MASPRSRFSRRRSPASISDRMRSSAGDLGISLLTLNSRSSSLSRIVFASVYPTALRCSASTWHTRARSVPDCPSNREDQLRPGKRREIRIYRGFSRRGGRRLWLRGGVHFTRNANRSYIGLANPPEGDGDRTSCSTRQTPDFFGMRSPVKCPGISVLTQRTIEKVHTSGPQLISLGYTFGSGVTIESHAVVTLNRVEGSRRIRPCWSHFPIIGSVVEASSQVGVAR
jgi:hypothetical protein